MNIGLLILRLVLGLLLVGTLGVAGSVHWKAGLLAQKGGYELALFYGVGAAALAFTGPGTYSMDNALGLVSFAGNIWGIVAVVTGVISGLTVIARGRCLLLADHL